MLVFRVALLVYVGIASIASGCGDSNESAFDVVEGQTELSCSAYSVYRCWRDHSDTCRLNEATAINFDSGCYETNSSKENCTEIEGCVEGEWLAEDAYGRAVIVNGCVNDPPPGSRPISNPSETLLSAAATSCEAVFLARREACSGLSVDDCLDADAGCRIRTEDVIDWEQYCDTGRERQFCEYPPGVALPGTISWHLCPFAACSGDEGPYEDCLDSSACVWTTETESQCLPTCGLEAPCETCEPLPRRTSDGVFETVDVCVP